MVLVITACFATKIVVLSVPVDSMSRLRASRSQVWHPPPRWQSAEPLHGAVAWAQAAHKQALPRACSGMRDSCVASKQTALHQHGGCFTPVACSTSMAHRLDCPHRGQMVESTGKTAGMRGVHCRRIRLGQSVASQIAGTGKMTRQEHRMHDTEITHSSPGAAHA